MATRKRTKSDSSTATPARAPGASPAASTSSSHTTEHKGTRRKTTGSPRVVAVTGAFGFLGRKLVRKLEDDPNVDRIVCIDVRSPLVLAEREGESTDPAAYLNAHARLSSHQVDLTEAGADRELAAILQAENVGSLVHLAFLSNPTHHAEMAHELETIGTLYVLNAVAASSVSHVLSLSSSMCYGARPDNPAWITEDRPLHPPQGSRSIRDKAEADTAALRFAHEHPHVGVCVARLGAVLGGGTDHFWTRTLARHVVPTVLGYDPLLQFLHPDDAVDGLYALWKSRVRGPINLVGRGVLPLSRVLQRLGRVHVPLPAGLGRSIAATLWSAQLVDMPPAFLNYLRWSWVCDDARMVALTGFSPQHDITTTLQIYASTSSSVRTHARDTQHAPDRVEDAL